MSRQESQETCQTGSYISAEYTFNHLSVLGKTYNIVIVCYDKSINLNIDLPMTLIILYLYGLYLRGNSRVVDRWYRHSEKTYLHFLNPQ